MQHVLGAIKVVFRVEGRQCEMEISQDHELTRYISDESEVIEGREVPTWIELTTSGGADPDMHVRVELRDGSPVLTELSWKSGPGHSDIRQKHLRQTDIAKLVTDLVVSTLRRTEVSHVPTGQPLDVEVLRERKQLAKQSEVVARRFVERQRLPRTRRVMTPEFLQEVAKVYRENIDGAPTKTVGEVFNVQSRQASKYVDAARQRGYLPPTVRGQKKA
ncbi:hypothetical protein AB0876_31400 [Mycobacterium sp. NPDC049093]